MNSAPAPRRGQTSTGLLLAAAVIGGWGAVHVFALFVYRPHGYDWLAAPVLVALQTWLSVGMFIVAHDAIHGSLAPGRPRLNGVVGQMALGAYAGFSFRTLAESHHRHHADPGGPGDPDFHLERPTEYRRWLARFFFRYFGWREFGFLTVVLALYLLVLRVPPLQAALFWGLPAALSALQLFTFGTWLPHRHGAAVFADRHRARSLDYTWLGSLLACFHFGYHLEHHRWPDTPWWALPGRRPARLTRRVVASEPSA